MNGLKKTSNNEKSAPDQDDIMSSHINQNSKTKDILDGKVLLILKSLV